VIVVVTVAAVAVWIGLRGLPGRDVRPALDTERVRRGQPESEPFERERPGEPTTTEGAATPEGSDRGERAAPAAEEAVRDVEGTGREPLPSGTIEGPGGRYTVFVSSHRIRSAARIESDELGRAGVRATIVETEVGDTGTWYRVAVSGGYPTLTAARAALGAVAELGYGGAWIERSQESH
jgi:hypothetical protein